MPYDAGNEKEPVMDAAARKLVIDRIVFQEATFADALEFLKRKTVELSGGKVVPIFVIRHDASPRGPVTLDLRNVSVFDALSTVSLMADLEVRWFPWGAGIGDSKAAAAVTGGAVKDGAAK